MKQSIILEETNVREKKDNKSKILGTVQVDEIVEYYGGSAGYVNIRTSSGIEGFIPKEVQEILPVTVIEEQEEVIDPKLKNKQIIQQDEISQGLKKEADDKKKKLESEKFKRVTYYVDKEILFKLSQLYEFQPENVTKKDFINKLLNDVIKDYVAKGFEFEDFDPDNKKHQKRI